MTMISLPACLPAAKLPARNGSHSNGGTRRAGVDVRETRYGVLVSGYPIGLVR